MIKSNNTTIILMQTLTNSPRAEWSDLRVATTEGTQLRTHSEIKLDTVFLSFATLLFDFETIPWK